MSVRRSRAGADLGRRHQDRFHHRPVGRLRRHRRPWPASMPSSMAIADFGGMRRRQEDRTDRRRPPEQARHRRLESARVVRPAGHRRADRRHQLRHRAGDGEGRGREAQALPLDRRRQLGLTNEQCTPYTIHYAYDTVALAKGTGPAVVKAGGKSWYFLTADYAFGTALQSRCDQGRAGRRRQRGRLGAGTALGERLLVVSCCRRKASKAQILGLGQRRRRHHQFDQGRQRVRRHQDDEAGRPADVHQRRALARPEGDAGHVPDRQLVLEPVARITCLEPSASSRSSEAHAVVAAGGRLLR